MNVSDMLFWGVIGGCLGALGMTLTLVLTGYRKACKKLTRHAAGSPQKPGEQQKVLEELSLRILDTESRIQTNIRELAGHKAQKKVQDEQLRGAAGRGEPLDRDFWVRRESTMYNIADYSCRLRQARKKLVQQTNSMDNLVCLAEGPDMASG